jgi:KaiC/GvpD/RAD55 family RecA-like ATPase
MRHKGKEGQAIYNPYPALTELGAHIRRGQLSMVVGPPGGGKTAFITDWMIALRNNPLGMDYHVLFFSLDSDRGTVGVRVAAGVTGWETSEVESYVQRLDPGVMKRIEESTAHIGYCFYSHPNKDDIDEQITAFAYLYGKWPDVIIVDNLVDVESDAESFQGYYEISEWLKVVASQTGAAVVLLHHARGQFNNGNMPLPLDAVLGQVSRPQRLILTLHRPAPDLMGVSVVKNSNGPANADGTMFREIVMDLGRMFFSKT